MRRVLFSTGIVILAFLPGFVFAQMSQSMKVDIGSAMEQSNKAVLDFAAQSVAGIPGGVVYPLQSSISNNSLVLTLDGAVSVVDPGNADGKAVSERMAARGASIAFRCDTKTKDFDILYTPATTVDKPRVSFSPESGADVRLEADWSRNEVGSLRSVGANNTSGWHATARFLIAMEKTGTITLDDDKLPFIGDSAMVEYVLKVCGLPKNYDVAKPIDSYLRHKRESVVRSGQPFDRPSTIDGLLSVLDASQVQKWKNSYRFHNQYALLVTAEDLRLVYEAATTTCQRNPSFLPKIKDNVSQFLYHVIGLPEQDMETSVTTGSNIVKNYQLPKNFDSGVVKLDLWMSLVGCDAMTTPDKLYKSYVAGHMNNVHTFPGSRILQWAAIMNDPVAQEIVLASSLFYPETKGTWPKDFGDDPADDGVPDMGIAIKWGILGMLDGSENAKSLLTSKILSTADTSSFQPAMNAVATHIDRQMRFVAKQAEKDSVVIDNSDRVLPNIFDDNVVNIDAETSRVLLKNAEQQLNAVMNTNGFIYTHKDVYADLPRDIESLMDGCKFFYDLSEGTSEDTARKHYQEIWENCSFKYHEFVRKYKNALTSLYLSENKHDDLAGMAFVPVAN